MRLRPSSLPAGGRRQPQQGIGKSIQGIIRTHLQISNRAELSVGNNEEIAPKNNHYSFVLDSNPRQIQGPNGIDLVALSNSKGDAMITLERGHVTSWRNDRGDELLFTGKKFRLANSVLRF